MFPDSSYPWCWLFSELSSEVDTPFLILDLQCDMQIMRRRIDERSRIGIGTSEADLDVFEKQMQSGQAAFS